MITKHRAIVVGGKGPFSFAVRELDRRTRSLVAGDSPGVAVSHTPTGSIIERIGSDNSRPRPSSATSSVPRWG